MKILRWSYLLIGLIFVAAIGFYFFSIKVEFKNFSLNLITEIIGIFITVFLIDSAIRLRDKKEKNEILKNALIQLKRPIQCQLNILLQIYKASCIQKPIDLKTNYKELFETDDFYNSIQYLDFKKQAPVSPKTDWVHFVSFEEENIKKSLDMILDKYAFVLDSRMIKYIDWITNSTFIFIISSGKALHNSDIDMGFERKHLNLLAGEQTVDYIKEFLNRVFNLINYFEEQIKEKKELHYDTGFWNDNFAPKIASGRIEL